MLGPTRASIRDPTGPIASFLFTGPTGVGKTELAKLIALEYYGSKEAMVRVDMSEYMEKHTVSRLLMGSPPGYLGHDERGEASITSIEILSLFFKILFLFPIII